MKNISVKMYYLFAALASILLIALDQWTKQLAVIHLKDQPSISIIENVFCLHYLENKGAAFGMMQGQQTFFFIMTAIVLIVLIYVFGRIPTTKRFLLLRICSTLLFAGAIGNLIDRLSYNYVIDFFYFELIDFPIFNMADIYVTVTVFLLVILIGFYYKEEELDQIKIWPIKKNHSNTIRSEDE